MASLLYPRGPIRRHASGLYRAPPSDDVRDPLFELARIWTEAAAKTDGSAPITNGDSEALFQRIDDLEKQLGPEYHALFDTLYDADPYSKDVQDILSMFDRASTSPVRINRIQNCRDRQVRPWGCTLRGCSGRNQSQPVEWRLNDDSAPDRLRRSDYNRLFRVADILYQSTTTRRTYRRK